MYCFWCGSGEGTTAAAGYVCAGTAAHVDSRVQQRSKCHATVGTHIGRRLECFLLPNQTVEPVHSEVWCVLQAHAAMQAGAKGVKEVDFVLQRIV